MKREEINKFEKSHFAFLMMDHLWRDLTTLRWIKDSEPVCDPTPAHEGVGARWNRPFATSQADWNTIEKMPGTYDWSRMDEYVKAAQSRGVWSLMTIRHYNTWDKEKCQPESLDAKPCNMEAYIRWVRAMVERYDGDGIDDMPDLKMPIKYWEVSNEPEQKVISRPIGTNRKRSPQFRGPFFYGTAEDYFDFLKETFNAIKEADPEAKVLVGGQIRMPRVHEKRLFRVIDFWKKVFSLGGERYFDIANIHSAHAPGTPEDFDSGPYRQFLRENDILKPYWITEAQVSSGEFEVYRRHYLYSEEKQAELLVKAFVQAFGNGAEKIVYTNYKEEERMPHARRRGNCLIDIQGRRKPAFFAMGNMIGKIDYFTSVRKMVKGQYEFMVDENPIYVLWGSGSIPEELVGSNTIVTDIYGNKHPHIVEASKITLCEKPIFVEPI